MLLHTVNKSPTADIALDSCLRAAQPNSKLLLLGDGIYAALAGSAWMEKISAHGLDVYALSDDVDARGMSDKLDPSICLVDYPGFVALSVECHAVQSWY